LTAGVDLGRLKAEYGLDPRARYGGLLDQLTDGGLLIAKGSTVRLTHRGLALADSVAARFF